MSSIKESPNRYPLPPVLTLGMLAVCYGLDKIAPIGWAAEDVSFFMRSAGGVLIVIAVLLDVWALMTFRKHRANIMPNKAATKLLTGGPFGFSRNPIYLANVLIVAGFGFALGSRWFLFGAVALFFLLSELVIKREEKHMEANFPQAWADYSQLVRRWI